MTNGGTGGSTGLGRRPFLLAAALPMMAGSGAMRVAVLDWGLAETLLALGAVPIALPDPADWRSWVVEPPLPDGVPDLGSRIQPNLERLAGLRPDLILMAADQDAAGAALRRVAPVLRLEVYGRNRDPWQGSVEAARAIGRAIGHPEAAETLIADAERDMAAGRAALAGRTVSPVLLASHADARHLRLYGTGSILQAVLDRMGVGNAWTGPMGSWGSATVGLDELLPVRNAALFVFDPVPPGVAGALARSPLWNALVFVQAGRVFTLPPVLMFGTLPAARRFARVLLPHLVGLARG